MLINNKFSGQSKKNFLVMGITFFSIVILFVIIQAASGLYPFGSKSNLLWDQDVQYVDYFAFYKDVLLGKASIGYSFSKSMGGSLMALFGYYLGCPLNLFVVFFSKEQIPLFMFILNVVKLGLAGCTAQYFLSKRFVVSDKMRIVLSVSYGLMQYVMLQSSNIMWLDGVILLPLLLLAVYRFITENRKAGLFIVVLCSVAVNWYTGYMTLLFAIAYFMYERLLLMEKWKGEWKRAFFDLVRFGFTMGCGVLGSCFLFYPTLKGLQNGKASLDTSIFMPAVNGTLLDILRAYSVGNVVVVASLYCGILVLVFFVYYFLSRRIAVKEKAVSAVAVGFMLLCCWFVPLECIWSGMRFAFAYRYRYAFMVVFLLIYLAAKGVKVFEEKRDHIKLAGIFLFFVPVYFFFFYKNKYGQGGLPVTIVFFAVYAVIFFISRYKRAIGVLIPVVFAAELVINGVLTFQIQYAPTPDITEYQEYVSNSKKQIKAVKDMEKSLFYRMDTLQKRYDEDNRCSGILNESMVYGYSSLNHYSSTHDVVLQQMLFDVGYSGELTMSVFSESILPVDSLFGIKYLLSEDSVAGYEKREDMPVENGKAVYQNPYVLGLGMQAADTVFDKADSLDPFEYQNQLFSNILGRETELYKKADTVTTIQDGVLTSQTSASGESNLLYGYVDSWVLDLQLYVDGEYRCDYATWLGYKTFHIGDGTQAHTITLNQYTGTESEVRSYFYYLDQTVFEEIIQELKKKEMTTTVFEDGHVEGTYAASDAGNMLLTIPYDAGWNAYVNGEKVEIEQAANALIAVPLEQGENEIVLKYKIPGLRAGVVMSVLGVLMFLGFCLVERRRRTL